jgi:hypothetical protein
VAGDPGHFRATSPVASSNCTATPDQGFAAHADWLPARLLDRRAAEPIQLPDHEYVAGLEVGEAGLELRPVVARTRRLVLMEVPLIDPSPDESIALQVDRLAFAAPSAGDRGGPEGAPLSRQWTSDPKHFEAQHRGPWPVERESASRSGGSEGASPRGTARQHWIKMIPPHKQRDRLARRTAWRRMVFTPTGTRSTSKLTKMQGSSTLAAFGVPHRSRYPRSVISSFGRASVRNGAHRDR